MRSEGFGLFLGLMAKDLLREHSSLIVDGHDRAPNRSMLRAVGFGDKEFKKAQIGVASTWSMLTPCNMHINELADVAAKGVDAAGGKSIPFGTITIADGISMGTLGMRYSLVSREVIADSIETVVAGQGFDGLVAIGGCDKNMPGCLIAMARLNRPSVFVYGGTIMPGFFPEDKKEEQPLDIVSVFEAVGAHAAGKISQSQLDKVEKCAIPGPGSCGGMYTANTMASAIEALGMSLPNSSQQLAISKHKREDCRNAGNAVIQLLKAGIRPSDIMRPLRTPLRWSSPSAVRPMPSSTSSPSHQAPHRSARKTPFSTSLTPRTWMASSPGCVTNHSCTRRTGSSSSTPASSPSGLPSRQPDSRVRSSRYCAATGTRTFSAACTRWHSPTVGRRICREPHGWG